MSADLIDAGAMSTAAVGLPFHPPGRNSSPNVLAVGVQTGVYSPAQVSTEQPLQDEDSWRVVAKPVVRPSAGNVGELLAVGR
jgi:hypothetical protein